ncbi:MAG: hypothetical protein P4N59_31420 [Negativicutes bacterium]|nr:hypothetical protein [Negativicutes bacterium]
MIITRIIRAPRPDTIALLVRRMAHEARKKAEDQNIDAIGLIQTDLPNLFYYADIGQKAGNVVAVEILGNCPQHISTIAFLGSNEAVNATMAAIIAVDKHQEK